MYEVFYNKLTVPDWTLIVKPNSVLCLVTDNGDLSLWGNSYEYVNKISVISTGKSYSLYNYNNTIVQENWVEHNFSMALSFIVVNNRKCCFSSLE